MRKTIDRIFFLFTVLALPYAGFGAEYKLVIEDGLFRCMLKKDEVDISYCQKQVDRELGPIKANDPPYYLYIGGQCFKAHKEGRGQDYRIKVDAAFCESSQEDNHQYRADSCYVHHDFMSSLLSWEIVDAKNCEKAVQLPRFFGYHRTLSKSSADCFEMDQKTHGERFLKKTIEANCDYLWYKIMGHIVRWSGPTVLVNMYGVSLFPPSVGTHCFKADAHTGGNLWVSKVASEPCEGSEDNSARAPSDKRSGANAPGSSSDGKSKTK